VALLLIRVRQHRDPDSTGERRTAGHAPRAIIRTRTSSRRPVRRRQPKSFGRLPLSSIWLSISRNGSVHRSPFQTVHPRGRKMTVPFASSIWDRLRASSTRKTEAYAASRRSWPTYPTFSNGSASNARRFRSRIGRRSNRGDSCRRATLR